jgi:outer membrane protein assembly factor BamB
LQVDHDPARTGNAIDETAISKTEAPNLTQVWRANLDGKITAQPLFVSGISIGGQVRDVVVAVTSANSVYAVDAATGATIWRRNFGAVPGNCAIPGGFGIVAPPAIDRARGRIYTINDAGELRTLALADGSDAASGVGLITNPTTNRVWGGLTFVGSTIYAATASDGCDTPPWRGTVYRVDVSGAVPNLLGSWTVVPGIAAPNGGGGIWGYGGVSADASGRIYAATAADSNELYQPYADRIVVLDSALSVLGSHEPSHPSSVPCNGAPCDVDFGATPVVFQPSGCPPMVAVGNKDGNLYVMKASTLAASGTPEQTIRLNPANDWLGTGGVGGVPAYWAAGRMLFVTDAGPGFGSINGGVLGLSIDASCNLTLAWSRTVGQGAGNPNSTPTVANGVVYVGEGDSGTVHAFDAQTGTPLWNSGAIGGAVYAAPMVAKGTLFAATWAGFGSADAGSLVAFQPSAPPPPPPPPTGTVLLGTQTVESQLDQNAAGSAEAFQATSIASGSLARLRIYVDVGSTVTKLVAGVYADAGGHPGALLAQGSITSIIGGGFNDVPVTSASITSGTAYWIAVLAPTGTLRFRDRNGGCKSETSSQNTLSALPATWTTGVLYADCPISGFGVV